MFQGEEEELSGLDRVRATIDAVARRAHRDEVMVHAAALTYYSLLSVVPLLALVFAMVKALGGVEQRLDSLVAAFTFDPGLTQRIIEFVRQAHVGALTGLSSAFLLYTAYSLLGAIEGAFNRVWRVVRGREWWRQIADYLSVFLLTPFLLVGAMGATSFLQEQTVLVWLLEERYVAQAAGQVLRLVPIVFNVVAVAVLFVVMPNRRPNFRAILIAASFAGVMLQLVQVTYVQFQLAAANWTLLYGALAQIPVMMLWIYWSWLVILVCAELAAVLEHGLDVEMAAAQIVTPWASGLSILVRAGEAFRSGRGPIAVDDVARELGMPRPAIEAVAAQLAASGFLVPVAGMRRAFVLAREPAGIDLGMIVAQLDGVTAPPSCDPRVGAILDRAVAERHAELRRTTLADVLDATEESSGLTH
jgi:membrane protein